MKENVAVILVGILGAFLLFMLFSSSGNSNNRAEPTPTPLTFTTPTPTEELPFDMFLDKDKRYQVEMVTTAGTLTFELFHNEVPIATNNFARLVNDGFYSDVIFHRVIEGFMIQGGDPTGTGSGGPGYHIPDEPVKRDYKRGILAYANSGPNTSGSQFFVMHADYDLPPLYTIFGKLVDGYDTLDAIATAEVAESATGEMSKPVTPVVIKSARLIEL